MFCPRCASKQADDVKFCTGCGANLAAVRQVVDAPDAGKKVESNNNWVADMYMVSEAAKLEMERRLGITPEVKRYNEIKAGVITSSIGLALMIFLHVFMEGIATNVSPDAAAVITRIWVAAFIPIFVGIALMFNGTVISKKIVELHNRNSPTEPYLITGESQPKSLRPAGTNEFIPTGFSVTENTTRHLSETPTKQ